MPDPAALAGSLALAATGAAYAWGLRRIRRVAGAGRVVRRYQVNCFAGGLAVTAAATLGPLPAATGTSLTAHMVQHVVLLGVAVPLLALGAPDVVGGWALGRRSGRGHRAALRRWPLVLAGALALHAGTTVAWHWPPLYRVAIAGEAAHAAQHATFLVTGVAFWWVAVAARRRSRAVGGIAALFVNSLVSTALGAWLALAPSPVYGGDLADQQLAGAVMWGFGGLLGVAVAMALFAAWLGAMEREAPAMVLAGARPLPPPVADYPAPDERGN